MHCRMLADISWLSCVSRCFFASIFPTRVPSCAAPHSQCNVILGESPHKLPGTGSATGDYQWHSIKT